MNEVKLVTLKGRAEMDNPLLKTDIRELDNIDAGIVALWHIARLMPGLTWGDMVQYSRSGKMSGLLDKVSSALGFDKAADWVGDTISDAGDMIGRWIGSGARLATDEQVQDGVMKYAAGYATGGKSMALEGFLQELGPDLAGQLLGRTGQVSKASIGEGIPPGLLWGALGVGVILVLVLAVKK